MVQYQELEIIGFDFNTIILNAAGFYQLGIRHGYGHMNRPMVNLSMARSAALIGMLSSFIGGCALALSTSQRRVIARQDTPLVLHISNTVTT